MGTFGSPNTIKENLILWYDPANAKSYRGDPTINIISDPNYNINVTTTDVPFMVPVTGYSSYSTGYQVCVWSIPSTAASGKYWTYSVYLRTRTRPASTSIPPMS